MKIAISSKGRDLDAKIDERFGRAAYLLIIDIDSLALEVLDNSENNSAPQGAGIQAAAMVSEKAVGAVITGSCGPKAMAVFSEAGIVVYTGQSGNVREALERYKRGNLTPVAQANVGEKYGMTGAGMNPGTAARPRGVGWCMGGAGRGLGMGGGRGMGMGGGGRCAGGAGRGLGMGDDRGMGVPNPGVSAAIPANLSREETLARLKQQAADLKRQLDEIQNQMKEC
jgi:predicted Fe-Mo cluster-binding NifX family protein